MGPQRTTSVIEQSQRQVYLDSEDAIVAVRRAVRAAATELGFGLTDVTRIVTAASELARNICLYAGAGVMRWRVLESSGNAGIELTFEDQGPGIADVNLALQQGFSTGKGLGMGLPGVKRLMDEMQIESNVGRGTVVAVRKWLRR